MGTSQPGSILSHPTQHLVGFCKFLETSLFHSSFQWPKAAFPGAAGSCSLPTLVQTQCLSVPYLQNLLFRGSGSLYLSWFSILFAIPVHPPNLSPRSPRTKPKIPKFKPKVP